MSVRPPAVGAATGYQLAWVALLAAPLLAVVQIIAAQVGSATRSDLQTLTIKRYGRRAATILLVSVVTVNVVTIAADLQEGAAGLGLLTGVDSRWLVPTLGVALLGLLVAGKLRQDGLGIAPLCCPASWRSPRSRSSPIPTGRCLPDPA